MMSALTVILVMLATAMVAAPQSQPVDGPKATFHDDVLDRLVGKWDLTGIVHGSPSRQTIDAEWVLNHQFLRIYEKSVENVAGTNVPYEGLYFVGYDHTDKRYVAHLLNVFGGRESEGVGYGQRSGNEITFVFQNLNVSIVTQFIWAPESKTWRIVSRRDDPTGTAQPILDLKAILAKSP